jgi:hypothetical protein
MMRGRGRAGLGLWILGAVWLSPLYAWGDSVAIDIGGVTIEASPPPGWCFFSDATFKAVRRRYESIDQKMVVHVFYGDCRQVDANTRTSQMVHDFGSLATPRSYLDRTIDDRRAFLDATAKSIKSRDIDQTVTSLRDKVNKALLGIQVGEVRSLGVVGRDENAVYSGLLTSLKTTEEKFKQVGILGITAIRGRFLTCYVYADYESEETVSALLARAQAQVARLMAENP